MNRFLKALSIVMAFCAAHAAVCLLLHRTEMGDSMVLTILTIALVYALIRFYRAPFDVFLAMAFLACFAGFYMGTEGAKILEIINPNGDYWNNVIATSLVTLILGLLLIVLLRKNWTRNSKQG